MQPIPVHFSFAEHDHIEGSLSPERRLLLRDLFDLPDLGAMDDGIANGTFVAAPGQPRPLSLFTAPRVDYSLHRLRHYTGTDPEHFQNFVLFTNYQFYIDEFVRLGHETMAQAAEGQPYDAFVERIRARVALSGFLMTPDAAFGFERRGTPTTLAELGTRDEFEVVVVPTFDLDGREVRSSTIREAVGSGDLETAARLLGRPVTLTGTANAVVDGRTRLGFRLPLALPPDGGYDARIDGRAVTLLIDRGAAYLPSGLPDRRLTVVLERPSGS